MMVDRREQAKAGMFGPKENVALLLLAACAITRQWRGEFYAYVARHSAGEQRSAGYCHVLREPLFVGSIVRVRL